MAGKEKRGWFAWAMFWLHVITVVAALGMVAGIAWLAGWIF